MLNAAFKCSNPQVSEIHSQVSAKKKNDYVRLPWFKVVFNSGRKCISRKAQLAWPIFGRAELYKVIWGDTANMIGSSVLNLEPSRSGLQWVKGAHLSIKVQIENFELTSAIC